MTDFKHKYRVESTRLQGWDYSQGGYYFITICTKGMINWFGQVQAEKMVLNDIGKIVQDEWLKTATIRRDVKLDEFVVMPNHMHGILILQGDNLIDRDIHNDPNNSAVVETTRRVVSTGYGRGVSTTTTNKKVSKTLKADSLGSIIGQIKSICSKRIRQTGYPDFAWQPRFYDHIIRDDNSLTKIRAYIQNNPQKWSLDEYFI